MKINYSIIKKKSNLAKKKNNNLSTQFWSFSTLVFILMIILTNFVKADWEQINSIPYPFSSLYYLDVYLLPTNPNLVWVCGRSGAVIRSTDAGKTWKTAQIKDRFVPDLQLEKIHFVNDKVGFTSGANKMFKSTDGGVTWNDISDPRATAIWGHWFYDELNGIMVGDGCIDNQQFFRTTDGGLSWNLKEYSIYESGLTHVQMMSLNGKAYAVSSGFLWESNDGGYNWATKSSTGAKDWQEQLAVNGNSFLFPVSSGCSGGGFGGARMSVDGGNTWKAIPTNSACFGSYLLTHSNGWFAGTNRTVYHTTDAGKTWNNEYCGIPAGTDLDDIKFYNDTLGFVVGKGVFKYKNYNKEKPEIVGKFPIYLCEPESITLKTAKQYKNYLWSTGESSESIKINKSGKYYVKVWNTDCELVLQKMLK